MHTQVLYTDSAMSQSIQSCIKAEKKHGEGSMGKDFQTRLDRETGIIKQKTLSQRFNWLMYWFPLREHYISVGY